MQTEGVEKKGICYPVHFDPAVLVEENGDEIILFQREEGSWLKMSKKLYRNICWHLEHNQEFLPEYDRILKSLNKCNILANKKQKRLENVTVMLTDKCNLACKHCCASELSSSRDISFSILGKIIELEPMQITVTGGEPLLHKNIEEILCFLRTEYEGTLVLSTNGTLVEDYLDLIFSYIDKVEVSLDGVEEENTEKYRGGGVYQRVLEAVKILRQHEMPVAMSIVSYDGRETEKFFELNRKYGTVPIIRELYLNEKVLGNIDTLIPNGKEGYIRSVKNVIKKEEGKTELALCGACSYQIFLDCEGNVYPCGGLSGDALKIGNIRDAEIFERVKNSPDVCYRTVMQRILSEEKFSKCRKCRVRSFCWNCISDILSKSMLPEVFEAYCKSSFKKWELFVWKKRREFKMQYAIWVTNACNLRCRYCYEKEKRNVFMDRRTAEQIFLYIKKRSEVLYDNDIQIDIHGGEPLLNYDILQYLVQTFRAWKKDVYINMTTNATLFDEKKLKFVVENLDEISISLDGLPMVHDKNRITIDGRGTFKVVSEYIDELLKSTVKIIARMTVTHETVSDLYNGVVYLYNKGFNVISPIIDQGDEHWNEETMEKLKRQLIKLSDEFCNKQNIQIGLLEKIKYQKKSKCLPGDITMHIDTDGVIYPCAYTVGDSKFQMGNVTIGIDNNRLQKIRDINQYEFESCVLCNWKEFCCGYRCKLINYKIYGTFEPQYTECKLEHILLEVNKYRKRLM